MKTTRYFILLATILFCACAGPSNNNLPTVDNVDLPSYMGVWHEIARYPNSFQKGCLNSTATYTLLENGKVEVINECEREDAKGGRSKAEGTAWVVDSKTNAKLKVSFFWPFRGDYWVVELGKDYEYSVVSAPSMKYLWILSRTPTLPKEKLDSILSRLGELGFDTERLIFNNPQ